MRYPALEYQPGIAAEQLSPLAPPREPRPDQADPQRPTQDDDTARPLDKPTSISAELAAPRRLDTTRRYSLPSEADRQAAVDRLPVDF